MKKSALFFDIDGTLATYQTPISPALKAKLHRLKEHGNRIFLCTGRSYSDIPDSIREIGFDGSVCSVGAYVSVSGKVIYHVPFPKLYTETIYRLLQESEISAYFESDRTIYRASFSCPLDPAFPAYQNLPAGENIYTIAYHMAVSQQLDRLVPYLNEIQARAIPQTDLSGDIVMPGCDKGVGIRKIMDYLHLEGNRVLAFGDSLNDMEMLAAADYSIAMGHAPDALKETADLITGCFSEDGVLQALEQLFPE